MENFKLIINGEETVVNTNAHYREYIMACDILISKLQQKKAEFTHELKRQALSAYRETGVMPRYADDDLFGGEYPLSQEDLKNESDLNGLENQTYEG